MIRKTSISILFSGIVLMLYSCRSEIKYQNLDGFKITAQQFKNQIDSIAVSTWSPDTITLLFVGDVMQHKPQITAAKNSDGSYNYFECFQHLTNEVKAADISVANLETTLGDTRFTGYPMFCAPKDLAQGLKETGFNLIITANNHSLDRFSKGVELTINALDSLELPHLGTYINKDEKEIGHPYYITLHKKKLAFMNYTYGTNGISITPPTIVNLIDTTEIKKDLQLANAQKADIKIVCIHWGDEYFTKPNKAQIGLGKWLIENGATHVIGSHPHVIQPIEIYKDSILQEDRVVAYSLGNFISNMSKPNTDGGMVLKLKIYDDYGFMKTKVSYSLAWVGKPIHTKKKNYILYPAGYPLDSLNKISDNAAKSFFNLADKVMRNNHKEVEEYFIR